MEEQSVNNHAQQASVNPVPVSKKPNLWIIAGIILILLLVFGSIYVRSLPSRKPISRPPQPLASPPPISPTSTPDPTANLEMYKGEGFSFAYPSDKFTHSPSIDRYLGTTRIRFSYSGKQEWVSKNIYLIIDIYPEGTTPYSVDDQKYFQANSSETFIRIGSSNWVLLSPATSKIKEIDKILYGYYAITKTEGNIYRVSMITVDDENLWTNNKHVFQQILSTFKFTDQASAEGRVCGGPVLEPCPTGYVCQTKTIKSGDVSETSGKCVKEDQAVCTQDVKQCPDGSYVSRQPPTCEFAACPQR